ncbi:hypothetical protein LTR09_009596 [Extremus antarcticus]|uniref:Uncharacterized protein n=1 Tax=Extremus antarcticus TaxID=702011 RepID=A0AAJ0DFZ8_9PEZI|nr:hypothetical protein LTR09_009596 [Extremus antarcticus]
MAEEANLGDAGNPQQWAVRGVCDKVRGTADAIRAANVPQDKNGGNWEQRKRRSE